MFTIRRAKPEDLSDILKLFLETIRNVCNEDYTSEQINSWIQSRYDSDRWLNKIQNQYFLVAEINKKIVGFASLENDYLDLMYVHRGYLKQGIASQLLEQLEAEARKNNFSTMTSDVSITAMPFFEKKGFKELRENTIVRKGVELVNFTMKKEL